MAVFTQLSYDQVAVFIKRFDVGKLIQIKNVQLGTENSTFFINTEQQQLVLTLFEQCEYDELPFFIELLDFLSLHKLPVKGPLYDISSIALKRLAGRPALLFHRLAGIHPNKPTSGQCSAIGETLGKLHFISQKYKVARPNPRDLLWIKAHHYKVLEYLRPDDKKLMINQVYSLEKHIGYENNLPKGALHGDLFRDNTLVNGNIICGLIDFYNGCTGDLLFDFAILINDWCSDENGNIIESRYSNVINNYVTYRPFTELEKIALPYMLRLTALRYWISRLLVRYVSPIANPKDPNQYRNILHSRCIQGCPPIHKN
ncbi:Homoserine kinase [Candidatus Johnevansia muelleri]|uniref:Homoserine kinase n=1 Tax=Candidatus Johnevansia muelleri TaxID=1495769 RepID=A0A078KE79_9GAMM|nr:Homoserine kinase [Candidatus Evansia muelleri]